MDYIGFERADLGIFPSESLSAGRKSWRFQRGIREEIEGVQTVDRKGRKGRSRCQMAARTLTKINNTISKEPEDGSDDTSSTIFEIATPQIMPLREQRIWIIGGIRKVSSVFLTYRA